MSLPDPPKDDGGSGWYASHYVKGSVTVRSACPSCSQTSGLRLTLWSVFGRMLCLMFQCVFSFSIVCLPFL